MYERVRVCHRSRPRESLLAGGVLLCAVIFAVVAAMAVYSCWYQLRFRQFLSDLSGSTVYAYQNDSLQMEADGRTVRVEGDPVYTLYQAVAEDGPGRLVEPPAWMPDAVLTYGDGSSLELWGVELEGYQTNVKEGVLLRYVDPAGTVYCYDTDGFRLSPLVSQLTS